MLKMYLIQFEQIWLNYKAVLQKAIVSSFRFIQLEFCSHPVYKCSQIINITEY